MEREICQVTIGAKTYEYPGGTSYLVIAREMQEHYRYPIVLVTVDGRLCELHKQLKKSCRLEFITLEDDIGHKTYQRSLTLLLLKAMYHVAGHEQIDKIVVQYSMGSGYYCTVQGKVTLDQEFLDQVKAYMRELVDRKLPIMKKSVGTQEAREKFRSYGMEDKEKLFRYRRVSSVNLYELDSFEDYFYGFMTADTGYLQYFDLQLYDEGFVLVFPTRREPEKLPELVFSRKVFQVQKESEDWGSRLGVDTVGALNDKICEGGSHRMMLIAEALQEQKIAELAGEIAKRRGVKFVMIAGPSSSGKTTFCNRLSIQLAAHGLVPHPVGLDNYYLNRVDTPRDENGEYDFECLEALDLELLDRDLNTLLSGGQIELPYYNFKTGKREYKGQYMELGSEDILVMEGIHGLNDRLSSSIPKDSCYKVYISALTQLNVDEHNRIPTTDGRLLRRMVRDNRTRATSARETIAMWHKVRKGEEKYIFPYQDSADFVFNSALIYELSVLKQYAEPILFRIPEDAPEFQEAKRLLKFLDYFVGIPSEPVPQNSILREFIGGSCFDV